jgi:hypothetical protein
MPSASARSTAAYRFLRSVLMTAADDDDDPDDGPAGALVPAGR